MAAQPQRSQAVSAGRRRHGNGIGLAVGAVLRRNSEAHSPLGEVHRSVGGADGGAGADGGGNGHIGQIRAIRQHKVIVAARVPQGRIAVNGQARQVAGVVLQRLEAAAHRQILAFAVALLPCHAVQGDVGIAVQLVHELLSLHGGQGHGGCIVARVIVTDGGQDAHFLIIQIAQHIVTRHRTDQVARHRLGLLSAVLDGTGVVAVEHADLIRIDAVGKYTHKAAHGGLADLDGTQVIAVLHDAAQLAHQTAGPFVGVDRAAVGAAGDNAALLVRGVAESAQFRADTADFRAGGGDSAIIAAVYGVIAGDCQTADRAAAVDRNVTIVGTADHLSHVFCQTADAGICIVCACGLCRHSCVIEAVFNIINMICQRSAPGAELECTGLVYRQILQGGNLTKQANVSCVTALLIAIDIPIDDFVPATIISRFKRIF